MKSEDSKPIWIVLLAIAVIVAAFGWWGTNKVRRSIEDDLQGDLHTVLDANVTALEIWMANQQKLATSIAEDSQVQQLALELLAEASTPGANTARLTNLTQQPQMNRHLQDRLRAVGYDMANLVTTNLVIIGGTRPGGLTAPRPLRLGRPVLEEHVAKFNELFSTGEAVIITPFKETIPVINWGPRGERRGGGPRFGGANPVTAIGRPPSPGRGGAREITRMQVAAPIRDADRRVRGALALIINPETEFSRILTVARSGESGETYAFDQEGLMISQSRFDNQLRKIGLITNATSALTLELRDPGRDLTLSSSTNAVLPTEELIRSVADAVKGGSGVTVQPFRDYRGVQVVGAWKWLPKQGFGVATQIDAAEAFRPLRILELVFIILVTLLVLCASGLFVSSYLGYMWRRRGQVAELKAQQFGQYRIEEKIGEGGMGVVYKARHALLRRETAIKLLLPEKADAASVGRFEREVQLTCRLTHPNTIQVYDYGRTPEGVFYYAMEYLRGINLHDLVARFGPQPESRVVHILVQVCDSLNEAHHVGLVHRDIKPANVILCNRGGEPGSVKVLDFGLVREYRSLDREHLDITTEKGLVGTPLFMAPETIQDSSRSEPRSDIYSVGALGYFLLVGQYVFDAETDMALYAKHLTEIPIPPSKRSKNPVSPELEKVILFCLEKDVNARPQSVVELRALLLATPHAHDWTLAERSAWWEAHLEEAKAHPVAQQDSQAPRTIKVEVAPRS